VTVLSGVFLSFPSAKDPDFEILSGDEVLEANLKCNFNEILRQGLRNTAGRRMAPHVAQSELAFERLLAQKRAHDLCLST
jgi:hypothetical protein